VSQTNIVQTDRLYLGEGTNFVHVNPGAKTWAGARGCADNPLVTSFLNARHQREFVIDGAKWTAATPDQEKAARDLWGGVCRCERAEAQPSTLPFPTVEVPVRMAWWERAAAALGAVFIVVCTVLMIWGGVVLGGVR
jgi:hypothetical protein